MFSKANKALDMWSPAGRTSRSKGHNRNDGIMTRKCGVEVLELSWSVVMRKEIEETTAGQIG